MSEAAPKQPGRELQAFAVSLAEQSAGADRLSGVREVLGLYVGHFDLFGAVLWEVAQDPGKENAGRLIVQAQYFRGRAQPPFYQLPADSISARCIHRGRPARHNRVNGVWDADIPVSYPNSLEELDVDAFVSVPVKLKADSDRSADAALTFYRQSPYFSDDEYGQLQLAARLFPAVYRSIHAHASLSLLNRVRAILHGRHAPPQLSQARSQAREVLEQLMKAVEDHFEVLETSIYLHDPTTDPPGRFTRMAGSWPWNVAPNEHCEPGESGMAQVLSKGQALRLLDVAAGRSPEDHQRLYGTSEPLDVRTAVRDLLGLKASEGFPLSVACVPILKHREVAGMLRCSIWRSGPYHVDEGIMEVLAAVAGMIADWWDHWTREEQESGEKAATASTMSSLGFANLYVMMHYRGSGPTTKLIEHFVNVCRRSVPQADVVEVWLREEPNGPLVSQAGPRQIANLGDPPGAPRRNAFRYVLTTGAVLHEKRVSTFAPPVKRAFASFTVAPVVVETDPVGVLLLAASQDAPWPDSISNSAQFLANQLALYLAFQRQIRSHQEALEKLERSVREQGELLFDFQHQIRTPVYIARNSCEQLRRSEPSRADWEPTLSALTSSVRRAGVVANNLEIFVRLAQGRSLAAERTLLTTEEVFVGIRESTEFLYNKSALAKRISFEVRKAPGYPARLWSFWGTRNLIELAVDNLLDNAVKYSFADTVVVIEADPALYGKQVCFSFRNQGLRVSPGDALRLIERRFRGQEAQVVSPEGTGIGLWMVAEIMQAMKGRLEVLPTNLEGWNEFRLYFEGIPE